MSGIITALEIQKRDPQRVNVFIDGDYAFSLSLIEAARLRKGQQLSQSEVAALRGQDEIGQAVDSAAHFLSFRPRSQAEVRRNLREKSFSPAVIEAAVERLTSMGYLDDHAFVRYWAQNRGEFKPLSPAALRQELRQKGVDDAVIRETLAALDADELAYKAAQSQLRRLRGLTRRAFRQRLDGILRRRGFSYSVSRETITRVMSELDEHDPNYFQSATINED